MRHVTRDYGAPAPLYQLYRAKDIALGRDTVRHRSRCLTSPYKPARSGRTSTPCHSATMTNATVCVILIVRRFGLVQSFEAVGSANAQERSSLLAAGISTAMNATMLGLGVAIPCMICYSLLMARQNKLMAEIEQSAVRTHDLLRQRYYSAVVAPGPDATFAENIIRRRG